MIRLAAALALAVPAAEPRSAATPPVLTPLGLAQPAPGPAVVRYIVQLAGNEDRPERAVGETAARFGGRVVTSGSGKPEGPRYVELVFPPSALRAQRRMLEVAVKDLGGKGAGVLSGGREELSPTLEERKAQVAAEAAALKAERADLAEALGKAPHTSRLIDERLGEIARFDPEQEARVAILVVRLAFEVSPATNEIIITPGVKEKP